MGDLISRAAALDAIDGMKPIRSNMEQLAMKALCWAAVKSIPAVDATPVVHGKWLGRRYDFNEYKYVIVPYDVTTFDNPDNLFCSVCNTPALSNGAENDVPSNYCPYCGAKMDGDANG